MDLTVSPGHPRRAKVAAPSALLSEADRPGVGSGPSPWQGGLRSLLVDGLALALLFLLLAQPVRPWVER